MQLLRLVLQRTRQAISMISLPLITSYELFIVILYDDWKKLRHLLSVLTFTTKINATSYLILRASFE